MRFGLVSKREERNERSEQFFSFRVYEMVVVGGQTRGLDSPGTKKGSEGRKDGVGRVRAVSDASVRSPLSLKPIYRKKREERLKSCRILLAQQLDEMG